MWTLTVPPSPVPPLQLFDPVNYFQSFISFYPKHPSSKNKLLIKASGPFFPNIPNRSYQVDAQMLGSETLSCVLSSAAHCLGNNESWFPHDYSYL